jgi:hypothetical protein
MVSPHTAMRGAVKGRLGKRQVGAAQCVQLGAQSAGSGVHSAAGEGCAALRSQSPAQAGLRRRVLAMGRLVAVLEHGAGGCLGDVVMWAASLGSDAIWLTSRPTREHFIWTSSVLQDVYRCLNLLDVVMNRSQMPANRRRVILSAPPASVRCLVPTSPCGQRIVACPCGTGCANTSRPGQSRARAQGLRAGVLGLPAQKPIRVAASWAT